MEFLAAFFWMGGAFAAYRIFRSRGQGRFTSILDATGWPFYLGHALAVISLGGEVTITTEQERP